MKLARKLLSICLSLCIFFTCMAWIKVPTAAAAETTPASTTDDPVIIVSLGDSYSSGEGIEDFYGQKYENGEDRSAAEKVNDLDWLAHRSTKAWGGMLESIGFDGTASNHRGTNWFFVAASGAKVEHLTAEQIKEYNYGGQVDSKNLSPQLDIFNTLKAKNLELTENDFITITIGGNDIGFVDILTIALNPFDSSLDTKINDALDYFDKKISVELKTAYKAIADISGDATILVVGYPRLLSEEGFTFTAYVKQLGSNVDLTIKKERAQTLNQGIDDFNTRLSYLVNECSQEGMNIVFVPVADSFKGHEAYTGEAYINGYILGRQSQDLTGDEHSTSAYSFHPNEIGAAAYAEAVQKKINEIEASKRTFTALQTLINSNPEGEVLKLYRDYTALPTENRITIAGNQTITIDLNGHTIDRHLTTATQDGNVIYNEGNLTIIDSGTGGKITGGNTLNVGGGIYNSGKLTLKSGSITGNTAKNNGGGVLNINSFTMDGGTISDNNAGLGGGGGVFNVWDFIMSGGSITDNTSKSNGGGVFTDHHFIMYGGSITGNNAKDKGGGVYCLHESFQIDIGNVITITGNSVSSNTSNISLENDIHVIVNNIPVTGSKIGITTSDDPTGANPLTITENCKGDISYLVSDNPKYVVAKDGDSAKLAVPVKVTFNKNDGSGTTEEQTIPGGIETTLKDNPFTLDHHGFSSWTTEVGGTGKSYDNGAKITVTEDTILYAQWSKNKYPVEFINADGTRLQYGEIEYGETPKYNGPTPTITPTAQYTYTFKKWSPDIEKVKGDATYTATYTKTINKYTIKFVNDDGTELQSSEIEYGQTPVYSKAPPTKAADAQYTYTFDKWYSDIVEVVGDATYTATYTTTTNKYTIKFVNEDGTELQSSEVEYGETPVYSKATPTKAADAQYTYTFDKWDSDIEAVKGDATYTATFTNTTNKYKITFKNFDGTVLQSSEVEYGETPKYLGETPVKAPDDKYNYIFAKWSSEIVKVTGDATYTATFKQSTCRHIPEEKKIENKKEPTCTEEGSYDEVIYCETCKEELSRKTITEDPIGHNFGDWEVVQKPTLTEKGMEQRVCANDSTHIETREIEKLPKMVYKNSFETVSWQKGSGKALTWTIHRAEDDKNCILHYWYTLLNGEKIPVDAKSGSTIITISAEILEKLSAGTHTITVVFDDGEVTLPLLISAATPSPDASPTTGDNSNPALWYLLTFCSLAGLALFTRYGRKRAEE